MPMLGQCVAWSALLTAAIVAAQDTQPAINSYIGLVQSAAGVINSANSRDAATRTTSSSSAPSTPAAATSAPATTTPPPAHHSSNHKTLIIAVVCGVVGALLLGLILLALCCCLKRRRKRRNRHVRTPSPVPEREPKSWKANQPDNPGRNYAPLSSQGQVPSMSEHPTTPMAAYKGGPHLEQHPAYRPENPFVPVPPSPRKTHHQANPSYATDATIAPYAPMTTDPEKQPLAQRSRSNSPYRPGTGSSGLPTHAGPERPPTPFGLMGAGAAGAAAGAAGVAAAKHHDQHRQEPSTTHRRSYDPIAPATANPSSSTSSTAPTDRSAGYSGTAPLGRDVPVPAQQPYRPNSGGPLYNVPIPIKQSRKPVPGAPNNESFSPQQVSAPRSQGVVPNAPSTGMAESRQPYTSIGEPYNDMHVHVLQNSAPSRTLQHSPPPATDPNPAMTTMGSNLSAPHSTPYDPPAPVGTKIPRYSTPPQVPSRSPRRSVQHDSDGEIYDSTTASSSDNGWQPSYAPAVSTEHSSSPHSSTQQHTPRGSHGSGSTFPRNSSGQNVRFSNSPTIGNTSVGPPPPVPWDTGERRYSPNASPRGSGTYDRRSGQYERSRADSYTGNGNGMGKRTSHSPATSINGQPRRLRFSDLQATEQSGDWETRRFNGGVGEAL